MRIPAHFDPTARRAGSSIVRCLIGVVAVLLAAASQAQSLCGPLDGMGQYGPYDYRTATPEQKYLVEMAHFTPSVETLQKGNTTTNVGGDISYTLRAFPNHPRALFAMTRLAKRFNGLKPPGSRYPVECWYDRAIRFAPDDPTVRVLYAMYLIPQKRNDEARTQLKIAEESPVDAQTAYNLGLAYVELKEYDEALRFARKAYDGGISVPGLREKLVGAGKWETR